MIVMGLAGAHRIFALLDEEPETDDGYVTLVNARETADGSMEEYPERTNVWAWKHPHHDGTVTYTRLRGDVRLEAMPGTRNKKIIHLTPKGKQYGEGIFRGIYKAEQRAVEKMTPRERQDCADALSKYVHSLKEELAEKD